jgi:peptide/nickel transport system substrate-binding protein
MSLTKRIAVATLAAVTLAACEPKPVATGDAPPPATVEEAAATAAAVARQETPAPNDFGDMLIDASIGDASNLLPFLSGDSASSDIQGYVYGALLAVDKKMNPIPGLAESYDVSDDGLTITFHLRDGILWHDGAPFTSADLMFQYEMMRHPEVPSAYKEPFLQIAEATAPDEKTFVVRYDQPYAPALVRVGYMTGLPKHLLRDVKPSELIRHPLSRKPVGTGPYIFDEWKSQSHITVGANPTYYKGRPYISRIRTQIIPDSATQFLEAKAGNIDMMGLTPIQFTRQTDDPYFKEKYAKYRYLANAYTYLGYNLKRDIFKDVRVRQALTYAIDKQEIVDAVLLGLGRPATGPYKPGTWAYDDRVKRYPFDPEKAKATLEEAGWVDGDGDGVREREGKPLAFTIVTNQGNDQRKKAAEIIQRRFAAIGVKADIRVLEWSSFIENYINNRDFDATILGWSLGLDPDGYDIWHSSKTGQREFNFVSYANAEVDDLLEKGRRTFDIDKRKAAYSRIQQILADEQPYTFLYYPEATPMVSSRVRGIDPGPAGIGYNQEEWWIPRSLHRRAVATVEP